MWSGVVKVISVMVISFGLGWVLYRCSHEDVMLNEDYLVEEAQLEEREKKRKDERGLEDEKAAEEGYKPFREGE